MARRLQKKTDQLSKIQTDREQEVVRVKTMEDTMILLRKELDAAKVPCLSWPGCSLVVFIHFGSFSQKNLEAAEAKMRDLATENNHLVWGSRLNKRCG